jgi:hypothetical protein
MKYLTRNTTIRTMFIATVAIATVVGVLVSTGSQNTHAATNDTLYMSPATGTETVGSTFTVAIRENSNGDQVNAAQANITYPTSQLQFVSTSLSGSAFGITATNSGGSGTVSIGLGSTSAVTGDALIANVTFEVTAAGSANVAFAGSSSVLSFTTNANVVSTMTGANLTLQAAATTTPPTSTPPTTTTTTTKPPVTSSTKSSGVTTSIAPVNNPTPVSVPNNAQVEVSSGALVQTSPSDVNQVTKVNYYLGSKLVATVTQAPYTYVVPTKTLRNGKYKLTTKTYYKDGTVAARNTALIVKNPFGWTQFGLQVRHYGWYLFVILVFIVAATWVRMRIRHRFIPPPRADIPLITVG